MKQKQKQTPEKTLELPPLKGPVRRGINWEDDENPLLDKMLKAVKNHLSQQLPKGSRKLSSVATLEYLLREYIKTNKVFL